MLECEDCWREVVEGRKGRAAAEAGRELAPQHLRERVRATVSTLQARVPWWRRRPIFLGVAIACFALLVAVPSFTFVARSKQPPQIALLVADFAGTQDMGAVSASSLPETLGDLELVSAERGQVEGVVIVAHAYRDAAGHKVIVYQSDSEFPIARGARHDPTGSWTAEIDGTVLYCADDPLPSLVIGDDAAEVALAASELGLN